MQNNNHKLLQIHNLSLSQLTGTQILAEQKWLFHVEQHKTNQDEHIGSNKEANLFKNTSLIKLVNELSQLKLTNLIPLKMLIYINLA